jgi:excinuclease ABC subunit A
VRIAGENLPELLGCPVGEALQRLERVAAAGVAGVVSPVLNQALARLRYLDDVGLDYLPLDRLARTLSSGESRRVGLTTALGSGLVNTLYVLDEPSIGLHPRDVGRLVTSLRRLRERGNTVVVVEHDAQVIDAAEWVVDIGPGAGEAGGRVVHEGTPASVRECLESVTGDYLAGRRHIAVVRNRREASQGHIELRGASGNNLKGVDLAVPLGCLVVVSGVSGAGKSSLVEQTLYPALARRLKSERLPVLPFKELKGANALDDVVLVDQAPIGRSGRSNPVTYIQAFDEIRKTFAGTHDARIRNMSARTFSFNVEGGRCSTCEGSGVQVVDMQFLPDVLVSCPECRGTRYRPEVLEVKYRGKSIAEVLDLTVREAFGFFRNRPKVQWRLHPSLEMGLDYVRLGQPASTLSGGESQRLKLAAHLDTSAAIKPGDEPARKTLYILDEPTNGLHPNDIQKLLDCLQRLVDRGNTLVVVEHHPEVIATADWVVDLGPEAGAGGGRIVAQGPPEVIAAAGTATGQVVGEVLDGGAWRASRPSGCDDPSQSEPTSYA